MRSVMTNKATPGGHSAGGGFILPKSEGERAYFSLVSSTAILEAILALL